MVVAPPFFTSNHLVRAQTVACLHTRFYGGRHRGGRHASFSHYDPGYYYHYYFCCCYGGFVIYYFIFYVFFFFCHQLLLFFIFTSLSLYFFCFVFIFVFFCFTFVVFVFIVGKSDTTEKPPSGHADLKLVKTKYIYLYTNVCILLRSL